MKKIYGIIVFIFTSLLFVGNVYSYSAIESGGTTVSTGGCNGSDGYSTLCFNGNHKSVMISLINSSTGETYSGSRRILLTSNKDQFGDGSHVYGTWGNKLYNNTGVAMTVSKSGDTQNTYDISYRLSKYYDGDFTASFDNIAATLDGNKLPANETKKNLYKDILSLLGINYSNYINDKDAVKYVVAVEPVLTFIKNKRKDYSYAITAKGAFKKYNLSHWSSSTRGCFSTLLPNANSNCPVDREYSVLLYIDSSSLNNIKSYTGNNIMFNAASPASSSNKNFKNSIYKNGYGIGIISIFKSNMCNPTTSCCYDKNGNYYSNYSGRTNYEYKNGSLTYCGTTITTPPTCEVTAEITSSSLTSINRDLDASCVSDGRGGYKYNISSDGDYGRGKIYYITYIKKIKNSNGTTSKTESDTTFYTVDISEKSYLDVTQSNLNHLGGPIEFKINQKNNIVATMPYASYNDIHGNLNTLLAETPDVSCEINENARMGYIYNYIRDDVYDVIAAESLNTDFNIYLGDEEVTDKFNVNFVKDESSKGNDGYKFYHNTSAEFLETKLTRDLEVNFVPKKSYVNKLSGKVYYEGVYFSGCTNCVESTDVVYTPLCSDSSMIVKFENYKRFILDKENLTKYECEDSKFKKFLDSNRDCNYNFYYRQIDLKVPFPNNSMTNYTETNWKDYYGNDDNIKNITTIGSLPEYRVGLKGVEIDNNTKYDLSKIKSTGTSMLLDKFLIKTDTIEPSYLDLGKIEKDGKVGDAR